MLQHPTFTPPKLHDLGLHARIALIEARYYTEISDALAEGALAVLAQAGANVERFVVPGALEIPLAAKLAMDARFDGAIGLGCVVRGETSHYDIVCNESARGLIALSTQHTFPTANAILTVETIAQAMARADVAQGNKGGFAADALLRMIVLKRQLTQMDK